MKKLIILLILIYGQVQALEQESTLRLYHHLFSSMSNKDEVNVYIEDDAYEKVFSKSRYINLVSKIDKADFVLITTDTMLDRLKDKTLAKNTIILTNNYRHIRKLNTIVGAFYYRKGRRQFIFVKPRLQKQNIRLPSEFNKYIVDAL